MRVTFYGQTGGPDGVRNGLMEGLMKRVGRIQRRGHAARIIGYRMPPSAKPRLYYNKV